MQTRQQAILGTSHYTYLLFLPDRCEAQEKWPTILFLHGSGERGSHLENVKRHGVAKIVEEQPEFPFIVISPQCPLGETWSVPLLSALLDEVVSTYRVDPDRIYLTGLSMGGYGTWQLAIAQPHRFAAIAPICGGGKPQQVSNLRHVPVWAFHGALDTVVPIARSEVMISALEACNGNVKYTVYPDADHDSWTRTYSNPALYDWFLQQRRS